MSQPSDGWKLNFVNYCMLQLQVCSPKMATGKTIKLLKVPVIIGTVPLRQQQQQQELEEDKGGPLLSGTSLRKKINIHCTEWNESQLQQTVAILGITKFLDEPG